MPEEDMASLDNSFVVVNNGTWAETVFWKATPYECYRIQKQAAKKSSPVACRYDALGPYVANGMKITRNCWFATVVLAALATAIVGL